MKKLNQSIHMIGQDVYERIPKAVFAAIAVSALTTGFDHAENATVEIIKEWHILYLNGIVPQKPPMGYIALLDDDAAAAEPDPNAGREYEERAIRRGEIDRPGHLDGVPL